MITAAQLRAARALVSMDQRTLADLAGLSLPTIQRMEASDGVVRGNVDFAHEADGGLGDRRDRTSGRRSGEFRRRTRGSSEADNVCVGQCFGRSAERALIALPIALFLLCDAALLILAAAGMVLARRPIGNTLLYAGTLAVSLLLLSAAAIHLIRDLAPIAIVLPLGLPSIGARFRVDALSAFFLAVINLGGAAASFYGIGHGAHEREPGRVLPFFPIFLAGMNLVLLADDAFTFLLSWELMSLTSWGLVMAHHREHDNAPSGLFYLVMASFGTLALLLAFGLVLPAPVAAMPLQPCGHTIRRRASQAWCSVWSCSELAPKPASCRCMSGCRSRASGRAQPCLGADEWRHDQGRKRLPFASSSTCSANLPGGRA